MKRQTILNIFVLALVLSITPTVLSQDESRIIPSGPGVRTYYIAADEVDWNYAPNGEALMMGVPSEEGMGHHGADVFLQNGPDRIGTIYRKAIYRQYTDDTFTQLVDRPAEWEHLGLLGPVIRAEVGETIVVVFQNNASRPYDIHPHGVLYHKDSEGAPYTDGTTGDDRTDDAVPPGETHTYIWEVPERAGPGPNDPSSIAWVYHSHVDEVGDTNAGLVGVILISRAGTLDENDRPVGIDREFVTLFKIFNENHDPYLDDNIQRFTGDPSRVDREDEDFEESNLKHSINGYIFGNVPGLTMHEGDTVRWYVVSLGSEPDLHTPHWHGITALWQGTRVDILDVFPGQTEVLDMIADNPGTWLFHCHVDDHIEAGMAATFTILPAEGS